MNPETILALRDLYEISDKLYWIAAELAQEAKKPFLHHFFVKMRQDLSYFECLHQFI